jgi:hypothetical protein
MGKEDMVAQRKALIEAKALGVRPRIEFRTKISQALHNEDRQ